MERFVYSDANSAAWFSDCFPWYAELELPGLYIPRRVTLPALDAYGAVLRVYGSRDGLNYERIAFAREECVEKGAESWQLKMAAGDAAIRRFRVQIVDCIKPPKELVKEIVLEAEKAVPIQSLRSRPLMRRPLRRRSARKTLRLSFLTLPHGCWEKPPLNNLPFV